ncbi:ribonuclease R [Denitrovibrio acetiphilus DSM 12809]|uniref:Ribonuclease R n=1 Tax=Denitrovibrio acetiphilus (strain DSM 12809 / NBRC 114555 / N2460) TaxID=522772 RepID=D4H3I7_DENA2|nr:ribonuclease R [Denitrovibrio acetiphilus]ADD69089.1 ribonuclease R [Denitrovibrio acetiphilus DSM 12809]
MNKTLKILNRSKKPLTFKQLLSQSGLDAKTLKRQLRDLVRQNKAEKYRNGTFVSKNTPTEITGKLDLHPNGYGFLSHDGEGRDIFIPKNKMNGAMHGDKVTISPETFRGKQEGRVVEIVERSEQKIVGRIENLAGIMRVVPMTRKVNTYIYLTSNKVQYKDDTVVLVELTHFPSEGSAARGQVNKVLGMLSDPRIEDEIVLNRYDIDKVYPESIEKYVEKTSPELMKNPGARTDLRSLPTVTIDGETAKDFDDAISIEKTENEFILYVHIADVCHFVQPGTPVDNEAYRRGTSFYFPEFAVPMLPESLSNGLCSLRPNEDRLALTAKITYTKDGQRKKAYFYRSIINSDRRLTYNSVNDVLEKNTKEKDKAILDLLKDSKELAGKIMVRRAKAGMLDFDFPETTFELDENGEVTAIIPAERHLSHRIIEHFMIEANEVVSEFLEKHTKKSVYRIHDKPDPMKLEDFAGLAATFGVDVTVKDVTPKDVKKINEAVNNSDYADILGGALVRTMAKAEYNTNNIGHFGLASDSYTHFTSPIRRYPDLMVHRLICNTLFGTEYHSEAGLDDACKLSTENEQRAENAERDISKFKKLKYLAKHVDEPFGAVVMSVGAFGLNIYIESVMLKGTVSLESIPGDVYQFMKKEQIVRGRVTGKMFRAADLIEVMVERIDMDMQEAYFFPAK